MKRHEYYRGQEVHGYGDDHHEDRGESKIEVLITVAAFLVLLVIGVLLTK